MATAQGRGSDKIRYVNFRPRRLPGVILPVLLVMTGHLAPRLIVSPALGATPPPSVVFLLLDTTRADRLGAWGGPHPTSPHLDALAASGIRFARHYANSHATRPSMPQLMTGRYYHQSILRPFRPDDHPREFAFSRPDPTAVLLPRILRDAGFQTLAVSAHPWVAPKSAFAEPFATFELLPAPAPRGHADAAQVVDRALELWRARDLARPTFLYVHLMDPHMPRFLPDGEPRFAVPGYEWRRRFRPDGEPSFGRERRDWNRFDASDFTPDDRRHFAAVYDTLIAHLDDHVGRLLAALRADDPELTRTVVVVTADHGEELGNDGRIDHGDSLADAVQHVPWIMAGAGISPRHVVHRLTEHVDVVPTLLAHLRIPQPPGTRVDGRPQLAGDGGPCAGCAKAAAYYAWEDYRGVRRRRHLLRQNLSGSLRTRCEGELLGFTIDGDRRVPLAGDRLVGLRRLLAWRLDPLERAFRASRYGPADRRVLMRSDFWRVGGDGDPALPCLRVDEETPASAFQPGGWLATGRGLALLDRDGAPRIDAAVDLPDGSYGVELATVPIPPMPWVFGFARWRKAGFQKDKPSVFIPHGLAQAEHGVLRVSIPPDLALGTRVVGLRLTPAGARPDAGAPAPDEEHLRRLRALGYVE